MQKRIWESVGGKPGKYDNEKLEETLNKCAEKVGWYVKEKDEVKDEQDLTFSLNAPAGHLPLGAVDWNGGSPFGWVVCVVCLFGLREDGVVVISTCKL